MDRVGSWQPESVLRAAASAPHRRETQSPNELFYLDTPRRPPVATARARDDEGDARLIGRLRLERACPRCGSDQITWRVTSDGRALGRCWGCRSGGTVDEMLQRGPRVSPVLFAVKAACRRVALGIAPRRSLPLTNQQRWMAKGDPVLAAALDDLEVIVSARLHVLARHGDPGLDAMRIPLTLDFLRFRPGRHRVSRHEARRRVQSLLDAGVIVRAAVKGGHAVAVPVYALARGWNARRAAGAPRSPGRRKVLCVLPDSRWDAAGCAAARFTAHVTPETARAGP
jgi:hypothetical protein